jgi:hypothetical protein
MINIINQLLLLVNNIMDTFKTQCEHIILKGTRCKHKRVTKFSDAPFCKIHSKGANAVIYNHIPIPNIISIIMMYSGKFTSMEGKCKICGHKLKGDRLGKSYCSDDFNIHLNKKIIKEAQLEREYDQRNIMRKEILYDFSEASFHYIKNDVVNLYHMMKGIRNGTWYEKDENISGKKMDLIEKCQKVDLTLERAEKYYLYRDNIIKKKKIAREANKKIREASTPQEWREIKLQRRREKDKKR